MPTNIFNELRLALRSLRKSPGHAILTTMILACGLGLTLLMFSAINAYVLKPLPFPDSQQIVRLSLADKENDNKPVPYLDLLDWRERQTGFTGLAGFYTGTVNLSGTDRPVRFEGGFVTANVFEVLGVVPALGRAFLPGEDQPGAPLVVVLGHDLWRNQFAADPKVVGTTVRANGEQAEVVGVMPPGFAYPAGQDVWLPLRLDRSELERGKDFYLAAIGRVRDGVSISGARAELVTISQELGRLYPETNSDTIALVEPLAYQYVDLEMRLILFAMFGSVILVLVIACANVANLLFVRFASRQREIATRAALGADRWQLIAPILAECLVVSGTATLLGLALAQSGASFVFEFLRANWDDQPFWADIAIDWRSVVFAAVAALLTTLLAGLVPALRSCSIPVSPVLRSGGRGPGGSPLGRMSRSLVVIEIALSCVVLICAGLMVRSVVNLNEVELGANTERVLSGRIGLFESVYPEPEDRLRLYEALTERLVGLPGVEAATLSTSLPGTFTNGAFFTLEGEEAAAAAEGPSFSFYTMVAPDYFDFFKVPILAGRGLSPGDGRDNQLVAVVSDRFADRLGGANGAVGQRFRLDGTDGEGEWITIVGVVPTVIQSGARAPVRPTLYVPLAQADTRFVSIALRTAGDPLGHAELLQKTVMELDPDLPVYWLQTLDQWVENARFIPRFLATMFTLFAVAGLALAAAGLYGVLAFTVVVRTQEFGVRLALGATGKEIVGLLARQGAFQLAIGLGCGMVMATGFARLLAGELFGVKPFDLGTFVLVAGVLALTATLASLLPARRALGVDPATALRYE